MNQYRQILIAFFLLVLVPVATVLADRQPNFVFLISEDNSMHYLKIFDAHGAETPRIEELAGQGVIFENAYSNAPVCSVARTTLITSCLGPRIGTQFHRRSKLAAMPEGLKMFPAYLRDAGYYTTNNRKKDYNAIEGKGVWDVSGNANWRGRKDGQPFFHKQTFGTTHESSLHFPESTIRDMKTETDPETVFVAPYHPNTPTFRYTNAYYRDRIMQVDEQIGKVVDELESDGLLEDTFIFYFGDHGGVLPGSKGYAYDRGLHIPLVVRIPANYRDLVDVDPGTRTKGFVSFIDFGPTLLKLAGLEVARQVDGKPFMGPGISRKDLESRDEVFGYADRFDEKWDLVRTLRKGKYEYIRNYQPFNFDGLQNNYRYKMLAFAEWRELFEAGELNDVQSEFFLSRTPEALYDLEADPHETKNLANDPTYASVLKGMRQRLTSRVKSLPDLSLIPESILFDEAMSNPVAYGQSNKRRIAAAVDVADLCLVSFEAAESKLQESLHSDDALIRYWACITASTFGKEASSLFEAINGLASADASNLVRVRAAEFLGLNGLGDPRPVIRQILKTTGSAVEAGLILNSVVLLQDGKPSYDFGITHNSFGGFKMDAEADSVMRRLDYLDPQPKPLKKRKKK